MLATIRTFAPTAALQLLYFPFRLPQTLPIYKLRGMCSVTYNMRIITVNVILLYSGLSYSCNRAEYEIDGQCCPMCPSGTRVYKHCTEYTSTSCIPCVRKTFIGEPNGLPSCLRCKVCDAGLSLKTESECTPSSDTVCGPLAQHYCIAPDEKGCTLAQRHTICKPGQFIKQNGTTSTDTICEDCPDNTFSDGLCTSCKPHTKCTFEQKKIQDGTQRHDIVCQDLTPRNRAFIVFPLIVLALLLPVVLVQSHREGRKETLPNPVQETHEDRMTDVRDNLPVEMEET